MNKKRLISGVKPTNRPHIGNYFGAIKQCVEMQDDYESIIFIADMHALTTLKNKEALSKNIFDVTLDYLACGLDPEKTIIFKQSDIAEHSELAWIFDTITTMPYLMRAHAYKDAEAKDKEINVGTFNYPMLMAGDILLYDIDVVPVGQDQKQHVEYTRDTAIKFNNIYGETFKLPEPLIMKDVAIVLGVDGRKMSKSYNNTIPIFGHDEEIKKAVMSIVTDSKSANEPKDPNTCNIFALHKLFLNRDELKNLSERYKEGSISYKESKEMLANEIISFFKPMKDYRQELSQNLEKVIEILKMGGQKAKVLAEKKMAEIKNKIGLNIY